MIHRTRQGSPPSSAPEPGREIVQMGDIWVEYSGAVPTNADLVAHLNPPSPIAPLSAEELYDILVNKGVVSAGDRPRPKPNGL